MKRRSARTSRALDNTPPGIPPRTPGRPPKLTRERQEEFCELLDVGLSRSAAARTLGCSPSAISKALARDMRFRRLVLRTERARENRRLSRGYRVARARHKLGFERLIAARRGGFAPSAPARRAQHELEDVLLRFLFADLSSLPTGG